MSCLSPSKMSGHMLPHSLTVSLSILNGPLLPDHNDFLENELTDFLAKTGAFLLFPLLPKPDTLYSVYHTRKRDIYNKL